MSQTTTGLAPSVILVGMGEIAQVLAQGFLKTGHPVIPVTRRQSLPGVLAQSPEAVALVLAVGEKDLPSLLAQIPVGWHERLVLIQNELLPKDWQSAGIVDPTVISIWFEKKPGKLAKQLMPSPVWGRNAGLMTEALEAVGLKGWETHTPSELSGGQQQRVAIARAIVTNPKVLLADEPTGNLDSARSREIMEVLVAFNRERGITIAMVTHDAYMAAYAKRIIRFLDGAIESEEQNGEVA